jgi:hypothetical protein
MFRAVSLILAASVIVMLASGNTHQSVAQDAVSYPGVAKGDHFLAAGPLPVLLTRYVTLTNKTTKTEVNLLLLTQERIFYQEKDKSGGYKPMVREATTRSDPIMSIKTADSMNPIIWTLDKKKKLFSGEIIKPTEIKVVPGPFSKDEESKYLFFLYLKMQISVDNALKANNQRQIKLDLDRAEGFAKHIEQKDLNPDVGSLFTKVKSQYDELNQISMDRAEADKKLQENNKQYAAERVRIDSLGQARMNVNTAGLLLGVLADDPRIAAQSFGGMSQAAANYRVDRTRLELAREYVKGARLEELNAIAKRQSDAALDLGSKISETRANSPLVHLYLAKLYAASAADKKTSVPAAREALSKAIKARYNDFPAALNNADLKKVLDTKFVYDYMMPIVKYKIITGFNYKTRKGVEVRFTNTSTVTLKDVDVFVTNRGRAYDRMRIDLLLPNQTSVWDDFRSLLGPSRATGR